MINTGSEPLQKEEQLSGTDQISLRDCSFDFSPRSGQQNRDEYSNQQSSFPPEEYGGYARPTEFAPGWQKRLAIGGTLMAAAIGGLTYLEYSRVNQEPARPIGSVNQQITPFPELFTSSEALAQAIKTGRLDSTVTEIENLESGLFSYRFTETITAGSGPRASKKTYTSYLRGVQSGSERNELLSTLTENGFSIKSESSGTASETGHSLASTIFTGVIAAALVGSLIYMMRQRRQNQNAFKQFTRPGGDNSIERPTDGFNSLGGMSHIIEEMKEIREDILKAKNGAAVTLPRGIVLSGPPGTGKTALVRALAGETGIPVLRIDGSQLTKMLKGTGPASVARGFAEARNLRKEETESIRNTKPAGRGVVLLLIDEIDSVATTRQTEGGPFDNDDERKNIVNTLLQEMDGIDPERNKDIIVVGTTNFNETLDAALMRPGRFSVKREIPLPASTAERHDILEKLSIRILEPAEKTIQNPDALEHLAAITPGKSGDELRAILEDSVKLAERAGSNLITTEILFEAFQRLSFGRIRENFMSADEQKLVAAHECGHGIMGVASGIPIFLVSMLARGNTGGRVIIDPRSMGEVLQTQQALLSRVLVGVGGQAAERFSYGPSGVTGGASGDLTGIRKLLRQMISVGMLEELYDQDISNLPDHLLKSSHSEIINSLVSRAMTTAERILDTIGKENFDALVHDSVSSGKELVGEEAQTLFARHIPADKMEEIQKIAEEFTAGYADGKEDA